MNKKQISLIVPTLNEEGNIQKLLQRIDAAFKASDTEYEIIFIDDHSKDKTVHEISKYSSQYPISCYLKKGNRGKGYSIVEGFDYAKYPLTGIIDADLQYPPEAIPEMIQKIADGQVDFVVANRDEKNLSFIRKFFSKGFKFFFGRLLHGFDFDVQAGLKVFRTQIVREVKINPQPWAWDLELALGASDAGYSFGSVNIMFADREVGQSKLNVLKATREIGWNAIKMKFRKRRPFIIEATGPGMIGSGVAHKGKRFITHTNLDYKIGALQTFIPSQRLFILFLAALFGVGLYFSWLTTAIITMGILSSIYFLDAVFNLVLVLRSLSNPPEINFNRRELAAINDADLPVFTVLCPLFRESQVLPDFIDNISKVDWPKEKLDVMLLLEEADKETIQAAETMNLPSFVRTVVVPKSMPQTKPKACNYGLSMANGEYLVIYDAEDKPEPSQLKKAYLGFQVLPKTVKCLQAKLNYFNPSQNLLTRLFTAEYSLWFDVVLPGLQSLNTSIPLGGTSNFFRVSDLRELKGWDPFNVTEDADLGTRLFTLGAKTAIIDSVTLEEANSNLKNWIRQRSRWIKGYMQTYLVHMRRPFQFWRKSGHHFFLFQLNVGGKIAFMLINPILWLATVSYFALNAIVGPTIESIYPTVILYMAATSLVFGNFLYFYYYMIGCAKRGHWSVVKYIFFIPFYWFFMSIAALMALYELIVRPHYWQKTNHGLHLTKKPEAQPSVTEAAQTLTEKKASEPALSPVATIEKVMEREPAIQDKKLLSRGGVLIVAMMASNFINFIFNAFLGRKLDLEDLGLVTLINTLWYVASIFIGGVSATINHRTAYLSAKEGAQASINFWKVTLRLAVMTALFVSVAWMVAIPFLSDFFHINDRTVLLIFTPAITLGVLASANRGFLQGSLMFQATAIVFVIEALTKLVASVFLVHYNLHGWVFAVIPLSIFTSAVLAWYLSVRVAGSSAAVTAQTRQYEFPKFFYAASIMSSISSAVFLSLDIILVKHYLLPSQAGEYALLALVGKMIYFLGSLPAVFMLTFVSRAEGLGKSPKSTFNAIFGVTLVMVIGGFISLGIFGRELVPVLLGGKTLAILGHLKVYTFAIALFTLANVIVSYHLARKQYLFPVASLITSAVMAMGIIISHDSITDIVSVIISSSIFGLGLMVVMHIFENGVKYATTNLVDFFGAFVKKPLIAKPHGGQRVLVFNWRDTKHVYAGGAEVYIHEIAKRMVRQGDYVTVFCGNDGKSPRNEVIDGVNIIRRGGFAFVYLWAFVYYFMQFRGQYDVIIDCHNGVPFFTPVYVKEPVVCVVHHIHQEVFKRSLPIGLAQFACFLERDIMALVYKNKYFVTVSKSSKEEMIQYGIIGKGIEIVHNGVDLKTFRPAEKSALPMVLYLGRLMAYKSIDVLVAAFKLILIKVPDAYLVIAGRGEEESHLKRLVTQLGLEGKVIFTGKVSEEDKIDLLQKAWVMVNPSFMEGWGITTIEANACGTPVIGSDVHGLRDSIQDDETGYLVPHGDTKGFANRITAVIEDRKLRKEMSDKSLAWAQNFSWEKSVKKLSSIVFSIK